MVMAMKSCAGKRWLKSAASTLLVIILFTIIITSVANAVVSNTASMVVGTGAGVGAGLSDVSDSDVDHGDIKVVSDDGYWRKFETDYNISGGWMVLGVKEVPGIWIHRGGENFGVYDEPVTIEECENPEKIHTTYRWGVYYVEDSNILCEFGVFDDGIYPDSISYTRVLIPVDGSQSFNITAYLLSYNPFADADVEGLSGATPTPLVIMSLSGDIEEDIERITDEIVKKIDERTDEGEETTAGDGDESSDTMELLIRLNKMRRMFHNLNSAEVVLL